jgi:hypothetical protein
MMDERLDTGIDYTCQVKEVIPVQAWRGPEGSRSYRLPNLKTIGT